MTARENLTPTEVGWLLERVNDVMALYVEEGLAPERTDLVIYSYKFTDHAAGLYDELRRRVAVEPGDDRAVPAMRVYAFGGPE